MSTRTLRRGVAAAALLSAPALFAAGCVSNDERVADHLLERGSTIERNAPLGGESLSVRKHEVKRAYRDLIQYRDTFETLRRRRDGNGLTLFRQFAENYMDTHLQPILDADWQSDHPELLGMDANIRLVQAECYMLMSKPGKMQKVLNGIEDRYKGRETMLVDYPVGEQSMLHEAIEHISDRKWD